MGSLSLFQLFAAVQMWSVPQRLVILGLQCDGAEVVPCGRCLAHGVLMLISEYVLLRSGHYKVKVHLVLGPSSTVLSTHISLFLSMS